MARLGPFLDAVLIVDGVNLSNHVEALTLTSDAEELEDHAMGDDVAISRPGLFNWSIEVNFYQDFAAGAVDQTLFPLYSGRAEFAVVMKPTSSAASVSNPVYSGTAWLNSYQPMGGSHGENLMAPVTFQPRSTLVRLTNE